MCENKGVPLFEPAQGPVGMSRQQRAARRKVQIVGPGGDRARPKPMARESKPRGCGEEEKGQVSVLKGRSVAEDRRVKTVQTRRSPGQGGRKASFENRNRQFKDNPTLETIRNVSLLSGGGGSLAKQSKPTNLPGGGGNNLLEVCCENGYSQK